MLAMQTTSLEILEKAELPSTQSRAILKVLELEMTAAHETLATKADLHLLKADLNAVESRLSRWVLTCMLAQTAMLAGWMYFVLGHSAGR